MITEPFPHGTSRGYKGNDNRPACRCEECTRAAVRDDCLREMDRLAGNPRLVDSGPAVAHRDALRVRGINDSQIGRLAGRSQTTISRLHEQPTCHRDTAAAILAIPLDVRPADGLISSVGTVRRLRALYWQGHSTVMMARELGCSVDYVQRLVRGFFTSVHVRFADAVRDLYHRLAHQRGSSVRTRKYALRKGFHGPLAWTNIDDPFEQPEPDDCPQETTRGEAVLEETAHLASFGLTREQIAERLGVTWEAVHRVHLRAGQPLPRPLRQEVAA